MGDRIPDHGSDGSDRGQLGEIIEVRGAGGGPPYVVRHPNGNQTLVYPGPNCVILPPSEEQRPAALSTRLMSACPPGVADTA
ncbi:DUF1918 domain-containing protein [Streptomyces sp. NPDC101219]|uniref:DUF1918 domain-containing protein n=1 Tax=Streptomyces sp. NPDC101219 TaxID=3366131 RepID=UPI003829CF31